MLNGRAVAACALGVLALIAVSAPSIERKYAGLLATVALERIRHVASDTSLPVRLTSPEGGLTAAIARLLPRRGRIRAAADAMQRAEALDTAVAAQAIGTSQLVAGRYEDAAAAFARIPDEQRSAAFWSDVAAAEALVATSTSHTERWLSALAAADRALALSPENDEALFNRAVILEAIGAIPVAREQWTAYLRRDTRSPWAGVARQRLRALPVSQRPAWNAALKQIEESSKSDLDALIASSPEFARLYGEGPILAAWADASLRGDVASAANALAAAKRIGRALRERSGEALLDDAVSAIEFAATPDELAKGQLAYRNGRVAYQNDDRVTAERELRAAADHFARANSPIELLARAYVAATLFDGDRTDEGEKMLRALLVDVRGSGAAHKALLARLLYQLSLCEAVRGHWSASLASATESMSLSRQLGEPVNTGAAEAVVSENYDFLGQPEQARQHGINALRTLGTNDLYRSRVTLSAMVRTELRGRRWRWAAALIRVAQALAASHPQPRLDSDMFVQLAVVNAHTGRRPDATRALSRARKVTAAINDAQMRLRFLADIDAADATLHRRSNPLRAVELLDATIAFQRRATRPLLLPELFLERGRAHLMLRDLDAARRDFDEGIVELERQRLHVADAELRPGLFDDAAELFEEAVTLELNRSDAAAALAYVERGRARTMLEQMEGVNVTPLPVSELRRRLPARTAVVEYLSLREQLAIFVLTRERIVVRTVNVRREQLHHVASSLLRTFNGSVTEIAAQRATAAGLYELLFEPIAGDLRDIDSVAFVPDRTLQRIPFSALVNRESGAYLIERYVVMTVPSSTMYIAAARRDRSARGAKPRTAVVFANPAIPRNEYPSLPSLHAAEYEATLVRGFYASGVVLTRAEATAARFLSTADSYDVVHFAGHALADERDSARSALIFARSAQMGGSVRLPQLARMRFDRTKVVVLAACSTMAGRNAAVEGVSSLASSFLVAGVPAVIGTLWDVDDRDAASVVRGLHASLARGTPPAVALREAQLGAIRSSRPDERDPSRWAAFTSVGASHVAAP